MKIHSVKYYDKHREWGYDTIDFSDLTLLVGVSGAGKTQILESLVNLKRIADGKSWNTRGVTWEISFSNGNAEYLWIGEFEHQALNGVKKSKEDNPRFIREIIRLNGEEIVQRNEKEIFFEGEKMPKLASHESLMSIFKEEESLKRAFEGFKKIRLRDHTEKETVKTNFYALSENEEPKTLEEIRERDLNIHAKLYYLFQNKKDIFNLIKEKFIDVFQQVIDIKIERDTFADYARDDYHDYVDIYIKEKGVNQWISQFRISSGMLRTFLHISEMYLLKKGTVVLIDEFENSLGINCINALAEDLMFENNDIQFIITSHHPYIINQIPYEHWKIVTRENGKIVTYDADEFNLGESHHERFMNLINLPAYKKGIVHA